MISSLPFNLMLTVSLSSTRSIHLWMVAFRSNTTKMMEVNWVLLTWHGASHLLWLRLQREGATFLPAGALTASLFPLPVVQTRVPLFRWLSMSLLRLSSEVRIFFDSQFKRGSEFVKSYKENIFLTGSIDALKNWSPDNALALSYVGGTDSIWTSKQTRTRCFFKLVVLNIIFSSPSHRYATRKHELSVQIHP